MNRFEDEIKSVWVKYLKVFLTALSGFVLSILFVRYFSPSEYGEYSFFIQMSTTIGIITSFGLSATLMRFIPDFLQKNNYKSINILAKYSLILRISGLLFIFILILSFSKEFSEIFNRNEGFLILIPAILSYIFLNSLNTLLRTFLYTSYSKEYLNDYIEILKTLVVTFVFWYLLKSDFGLNAIIYTLIIINAIIFSLLAFETIKIFFENKKEKNKQQEFEKKRVLKYGIFNFLSGTTGFLRDTAIDIFVISYFLTDQKIAFYTLGSSLALYLSKINPAEILKNIFYPLIFKEYAKNNNDINVLKKYSVFLNKLSVFIVSPFIIIMIIYAEEIIKYVYNSQYADSVIILRIFALFYFFRIFIRTYKIFFHSLEKNQFIFIGGLLGIFNFVLSVIFIQYWDIVGVALSTAITWFVNLIIFVFILRFKLQIRVSFFNKLTIKLIFNILIFSSLLVLFKLLIVNFLSLAIITILVYLSFFVLSFYNKSFSEEERRFMNSVIGRKIWKF